MLFLGAGSAPRIGAVGQDFYLNIHFRAQDSIDDIRWHKNGMKIALFRKDSQQPQKEDRYKVFINGTLEIRNLTRDDSGNYSVVMYDTKGKRLYENTYDLVVQEKVTKPSFIWNCKNKSLTCQVTKGSHVELKLYVGKDYQVRSFQKTITHLWRSNQSNFSCTASNNVSSESSKATVKDSGCLGKGLDLYLIVGICAGGTLFLIFVALLLLYLCNRKRQGARRHEEAERRAPRTTANEGGLKPHQSSGSASPNPAMLQPPLPPSRRSQAPGPRPPPAGTRGQHPLQKRPLPTPGAQAPQQKGPPLPRPRVPKTPYEAAENL